MGIFRSAIPPLSVQINDQIVTEPRKRPTRDVSAIEDAETVIKELNKAAKMQAELGLGQPTVAVERKTAEYKDTLKLAQAERLAHSFKAIKEPSQKFFPRFSGNLSGYAPTTDSQLTFGRLPLLVMVHLRSGLKGVRCNLVTGKATKAYEAPLPVIPPTILEKAAYAKKCAPDSEFHLMFMPSWEVAPQRDPVLVAYVAGEWFEVGAWNGDADLIKEFLEDK